MYDHLRHIKHESILTEFNNNNPNNPNNLLNTNNNNKKIKNEILPPKISAWENIVISCISKSIAATLTYPYQVYKQGLLSGLLDN